MTICKCDRCGKEIFDPHDVFILTTGKNYCRSEEATRLDLCEWCYRCLLDWVKADG